MYQVFKAVRHKLYKDLYLLPVLTYSWKYFSTDFIIRLTITIDWKGESYYLILVIFDQLTKMMHYQPGKVIINALELAKAILDVIVWHYGLPNIIVLDRGALFTSKFWSLLRYFYGIK